jgi:hypothetical protein
MKKNKKKYLKQLAKIFKKSKSYDLKMFSLANISKIAMELKKEKRIIN